MRVVLALVLAVQVQAAAFSPGENVRVTKGEMLLFNGENFQPAAKGQEFTVLKHDSAAHRVFVSYLKDDDALIAVTLPDNVVEPAPPNAWDDLVKGAAAFRSQRPAEAVRLFQRAAQDPKLKPLATASANQATAANPRTLRDFAEQLAKSGRPSLDFRWMKPPTAFPNRRTRNWTTPTSPNASPFPKTPWCEPASPSPATASKKPQSTSKPASKPSPRIPS